MSKKKTYRVAAEVTISIYTDVEARSRKEALALAAERTMAEIHHSTYDVSSLAEDEWVTSGELDGSAVNLRLVEDEE